MNATSAVAVGLMFAGAMTAAPAGAQPVIAAPPDTPSGLQNHVVFSEYSPLSRSVEVVHRLLTPLNARLVVQAAAQPGKHLREQSLDLANERFTLYVPPASSEKYALLVFIPPWERAEVPTEWVSALERHHMIFVSAANSGNAANVLDRREPLALLALHNVVLRYPVDQSRVYIAGFSGGSRVALRLLVGYPDAFRGALLMAGSDPIGQAEVPLPSGELLRQLQDSARVVYATGGTDEWHRIDDVRSRKSMQEFCIFDVAAESIAFKNHQTPDGPSFEHLLDTLSQQTAPDAAQLKACRARLGTDLDDELAKASALLRQGKLREARRMLVKLDARFGGLAAPRSVDLAEALDGHDLRP